MAARYIKYRLMKVVTIGNGLHCDGASRAICGWVPFRIANVFISACAIVMASVGMNMNAIPVMIGVELVLPVMGMVPGFNSELGIGWGNTECVND